MCGIFGYTGSAEAAEKLLSGLRMLEYRGYDSAGIAILNGSINTVKSEGNIQKLSEKLEKSPMEGTAGIAHTRWATHGKATENNAHPHVSNSNRFVLVHNGIIDNYSEIAALLKEKGFEFYSETDTEVLVNFLSHNIENNGMNVLSAIRHTLDALKGSYAFGLMDREDPETIWISRSGAPLVLGMHEKEYYVSSDIHALLGYCENAVFLDNHHIAKLKSGEDYTIWNRDGVETNAEVLATESIEQWGESVSKGEFEHITLKEIFEQPDVMRRLLMDDSHLTDIDGMDFSGVKRIVLLGCGTSLHAAMLARHFFEKYLRIPVIVEQASEFKYSDPILFDTDLVIGISQSGETADTLQACYLTRDQGVRTIGMTNSAHSTMTRELDACIYLKAGKEIGVASTKAFTAQIMVFLQLMLRLGPEGFNIESFKDELKKLPVLLEGLLEQTGEIEAISADFSESDHFLFIGRGMSFPMAMEGALKLKELSYIHAEGYQAAELKHGPLALLDDTFPVVLVAGDQENLAKNIATANEIVSRSGRLISVVPENDTVISSISEKVIRLPKTDDRLTPLMSCIPLQLFSFYMALQKGRNVDQPRNLAKSVTVE